MTPYLAMPEIAPEWQPRTIASYPIKLHLRYEVMAGKTCLCAGEGCTVSISRTAVVFEAPETLPIDRIVRLCSDWPVPGVAFDIQGRTIQSRRHTAVEELRHGFRLDGSGETARGQG